MCLLLTWNISELLGESLIKTNQPLALEAFLLFLTKHWEGAFSSFSSSLPGPSRKGRREESKQLELLFQEFSSFFAQNRIGKKKHKKEYITGLFPHPHPFKKKREIASPFSLLETLLHARIPLARVNAGYNKRDKISSWRYGSR